MRLIAVICTLPALTAALWAGQQLWLEMRAPAAPAVVYAAPAASDRVAEPQPRPNRRWSALFGEKQPPKPQPPTPTAEPQPPKPPVRPLQSFGYALNGVVQTGGTAWAMVSHPTGEHLVRPGDVLDGGLTVMRIDKAGLWVSRDGEAAELLAFPE